MSLAEAQITKLEALTCPRGTQTEAVAVAAQFSQLEAEGLGDVTGPGPSDA